MGIKTMIMNFSQFLIRSVKEEKIIPITQLKDINNLLDGRTAIITGGSSGIGYAIAESFISSGACVIICARDEAKLIDACQRLGEKSRYAVLDVTKVESFEEVIDRSEMAFGKKQMIDILVNSAGIVPKSDFFSMSEQEYDKVMDINAKGTYFMTQAVSKRMIQNRIKGHILNVTSSSALRPAWSPYQMSKWAVKGLTMGLADTLIKEGIIVNAIAPGPTATPLLGRKEGDTLYSNNPIGRYATPSEIASLATILVSDLGNIVVGDTLYATGGSGVISYHS